MWRIVFDSFSPVHMETLEQWALQGMRYMICDIIVFENVENLRFRAFARNDKLCLGLDGRPNWRKNSRFQKLLLYCTQGPVHAH